MRKNIALFLLGAVSLGSLGLGAETRKPDRPNFVFILVDDLGAQDLGYAGSKFYETPNIDRLARQGIQFTAAYAAAPVCSPTRASLLTGKYPARLRITDWIPGEGRKKEKLLEPKWTQYLSTDEPTLARVLKTNGYTTGAIGKWHMGGAAYTATQHGFDVSIGGDHRGQPPSYFSPYKIPTLPDGPVGEFLTDRESAEAVKFIEANRNQPFFLYLSHYAVHTPLAGKLEIVEKYKRKVDPVEPQNNATYAALVESVDDSVGRILRTLDDLNLADHTVVIFTSDNGGLTLGKTTSNAPLRNGKGTPYEGGLRVPMIIRPPVRGDFLPGSEGSRCDTPVISPDLYPTILELAGVPDAKQHTIDGKSLVPLLNQSPRWSRDAIYWHYPHYHGGGATPFSAVRSGNWKLIEYFEDHRLELFDLKNDPGEKNNLATAQPKITRELQADLAAWRRRTGAQLPTENPNLSQGKPNIIFILADDLGYADLGCYSQQKIKTPHLDRFAAEGMRFTQAYSGSPVCAPSRCVLLTGKHSGHAFVRANREVQPEGQIALPGNTPTLARTLKAAGYDTAAIGKWGLGAPGSTGEPNQQGFDYFFGYNCQRQAHNFYPTHLWRNTEKIMLDGNLGGKSLTGKQYAHDLMAEDALQFISRKREKPFFLYLAFTIPHLALQVPDDSLATYKDAFPEIPYDGKNGYLPHPTPRAAYAAMVSRMDRDIGRLMAQIKKLGLDENTIVFFSSDNGPTVRIGGADSDFFESSGPLRGRKMQLYEGGIRVPFLVRWPGRIPRGAVSDQICAFQDVLPTLAELAGAQPPRDSDGISLVPTLLGMRGQKQHPYLYWEYHEAGGWLAVREGNWKAVRRDVFKRANSPIELYDLNHDLAEQHNVAADHPDVAKRMVARMKKSHIPSVEFPLPDEKKK